MFPLQRPMRLVTQATTFPKNIKTPTRSIKEKNYGVELNHIMSSLFRFSLVHLYELIRWFWKNTSNFFYLCPAKVGMKEPMGTLQTLSCRILDFNFMLQLFTSDSNTFKVKKIIKKKIAAKHIKEDKFNSNSRTNKKKLRNTYLKSRFFASNNLAKNTIALSVGLQVASAGGSRKASGRRSSCWRVEVWRKQ